MDISLAQKTNTPTTPTVIANAAEDDNNNNNNNNNRNSDDDAALQVTENKTLVATNNKDKNKVVENDDDDDGESCEQPVAVITATKKSNKTKKKKPNKKKENPNNLMTTKERKLHERGPYDGITLLTLIQLKLLKVGANNLLASYEYGGEKVQVVGSLTENGHIYVQKADETFRNPRSMSIDVKRRLNPEIKFTEGWGHARYVNTGSWHLEGKNDEKNGQTLKEIRERIPTKDVPSLVPRWKSYAPKQKVNFVPKKNKNPFPDRAWNATNTESVKFPPGTIVFVETVKKPKKNDVNASNKEDLTGLEGAQSAPFSK